MDLGQERPPPMVIETYLDLSELTRSQSLVIVDDQGKRWDVAEALNPSFTSTRPSSRTGATTQVTLERWVISLEGSPTDSMMHPDSLSSVYKRGIPLFRSLYTFGRTLPAFRYSRRLARQPPNQPVVKLNYRIYNGQFKSPRRETLDILLLPNDDRVTEPVISDQSDSGRNIYLTVIAAAETATTPSLSRLAIINALGSGAV